MESMSAEITVRSDTGPWTIEQTAAARAAVRIWLLSLNKKEPDESAITECLQSALTAATKQVFNPTAAWFGVIYYFGSLEEYDLLAQQMQAQCDMAGLIVTIEHSRR